MKLTKKFIKENAEMTLKEVFPEVFEEHTGYYKHRDEYPNWICYFDLDNKTYYGIGVSGIWMKCEDEKDFNEMTRYIKGQCIPATPQEIKDALEKEAVRRGYEKGVFCKFGTIKDIRQLNSKSFNLIECSMGICLANGRDIIFHEGIWNEIVKTITKQEAEERLGMKII